MYEVRVYMVYVALRDDRPAIIVEGPYYYILLYSGVIANTKYYFLSIEDDVLPSVQYLVIMTKTASNMIGFACVESRKPLVPPLVRTS